MQSDRRRDAKFILHTFEMAQTDLPKTGTFHFLKDCLKPVEINSNELIFKRPAHFQNFYFTLIKDLKFSPNQVQLCIAEGSATFLRSFIPSAANICECPSCRLKILATL